MRNVPLSHPDKLFIDGRWVSAEQAGSIRVIAPATEELFVEVAEATEADLAKAIAAARAAFDHGPWPRLSHAERAGFLRAIAAELDRRSEDVASVWPNEMGVLHRTARAFAERVSGTYLANAALAESFVFEEDHGRRPTADCGLLVREPVGVVGAIIPWNGPISIIAHKIAPALLAGCTCVLKASPEAPSHALIMAEVAEAVGLPPGVLNVVTADREASEALVRDGRVDKIAFTGSTAAGQAIASLLGQRMARYTMELGGKSAAIILDDYDLEAAAKAIASRACDLTGQVCASLTRIIVSRDRHDRLLDALAAEFRAVQVGNPFDPLVQMGPVATKRQRDRVEQYIAGAISDGFTLAAGGRRPKHLSRGFFIEPTVFGNVDNRSRIGQEEVFGPVLSVIPVADEMQALETANDSPFGLAGSVFTNDADRAYAVARRMRTGTVSQNGLKLDFQIAFGGFKFSGVGREGGVEGLLPYLETKTLLLDHDPHRHLQTDGGVA